MKDKEQKLKQIIVHLRMQLLLHEIGDNCPHAYYSMKQSGCETGIGCKACKQQFITDMKVKIEAETALL